MLKGDKELLRNLAVIQRAVAAKDVDAGIVSALDPMRKQTVMNAMALRQPRRKPPKGGHLDQGVVVAKMRSTGLRREFWLTFRRRAIKIAHLVEFGTRPHWQPRRFGGWMHPGARPRYFFTRAYEASKKDAIAVFGRAMWARISFVARSMGGGR